MGRHQGSGPSGPPRVRSRILGGKYNPNPVVRSLTLATRHYITPRVPIFYDEIFHYLNEAAPDAPSPDNSSPDSRGSS